MGGFDLFKDLGSISFSDLKVLVEGTVLFIFASSHKAAKFLRNVSKMALMGLSARVAASSQRGFLSA